MNTQNSNNTNLYLSHLKALVKKIDNHKGPWMKHEGGGELEDGVIQMPYVTADPVAYEALTFLYYNKLIIDFDWGKWHEGRKLFASENENKFDKLDKDTTLKLLTAVARNDRFNEGAWASLFESGDAQKLFRRLLEIESTS